jgi:hypothetical protein
MSGHRRDHVLFRFVFYSNAQSHWRAANIDHALDILREIYQHFNWITPDLDIARAAIQKMFDRRW